MIRNIIYIPYYFLKTPLDVFWDNISVISKIKNQSKWSIFIDIIRCSIINSTSLMDYFLLRFYDKNKTERSAYAGTGFMYEYQLKMNPKSKRDILEDKIKFFNHFAPFIGRKWFQLSDFEKNKEEIGKLLEVSEKIVLKDSKGQAGKEVEVIGKLPLNELYTYMNNKGFDLIEEFVVQHKDIQELAPRGLNTIRIITQLTENNNVDIIGTILRLSIDSNTDNLSVGNAAASIDKANGVIDRKAVYGDFKKSDIDIHPISNKNIVGFKIPFWKESIELVTEAAKISNGNKSIGWDVAITEAGPILIEGNHNWGRTLWQLPVNQGLKHVLEAYYK